MVMALGAALSGLTSSWGTLLVLGAALLPRVAPAFYPPASPNFLLECHRGTLPPFSIFKADYLLKGKAHKGVSVNMEPTAIITVSYASRTQAVYMNVVGKRIDGAVAPAS